MELKGVPLLGERVELLRTLYSKINAGGMGAENPLKY